MASVTLHPDPQLFPIGTAVKVFEVPAGAPAGWKPSGAAMSEPTVEAGSGGGSSVLTVTGLTLEKRYLGEATVGGVRRTLGFTGGEAAAGGGGVASVNGKEGAVTLTAADVEAVGTASPAFTGTPTAPTQAAKDNSTKLATDAFAQTVKAEAEAAAKAKAEAAEAAAISNAAGKDATTLTAAEAVTATEKTRALAAEALLAPLASPALTGTPKAPTAAAKAGTTQIATTAYSDAAITALETALESVYRKQATAIVNRSRETVSLPGTVAAETIPMGIVSIESGATQTAVKLQARLTSGSMKYKLQRKNGAGAATDLTGFTALEATTTLSTTTPAGVALAEGDELLLVIASVESAKGLALTLHTNHSL